MTIGWVMSHWWVMSLGSKRQHWIYNTRLSHRRRITLMSHDYWMSHVSLMSQVSRVKTATLDLQHAAVTYKTDHIYESWLLDESCLTDESCLLGQNGNTGSKTCGCHIWVFTCMSHDTRMSHVSLMSHVSRVKTAALYLQTSGSSV